MTRRPIFLRSASVGSAAQLRKAATSLRVIVDRGGRAVRVLTAPSVIGCGIAILWPG